MRSKRGAYFFLIDVFLVVLIFFITIMTILGFRSSQPSLLGVDQQLDTITYELFNIEVRDYNTDVMNQLRLPGGILYDEGWNLQMTVDELIVLLEINPDPTYHDAAYAIIEEIVLDMPVKYGFNYTVNTSTQLYEVYSRPSLVSEKNSAVKLSQRKISWPRSNVTHVYDSALTEVSLWQ